MTNQRVNKNTLGIKPTRRANGIPISLSHIRFVLDPLEVARLSIQIASRSPKNNNLKKLVQRTRSFFVTFFERLKKSKCSFLSSLVIRQDRPQIYGYIISQEIKS